MPITIYQSVYPAVNEYTPATIGLARSVRTHYPVNEAPISPPDLEVRAASGRTVAGHAVLFKAYTEETYRLARSRCRLATSAGAFAFHEHGSPTLVAGKQGIRLSLDN